MTAPGVAAEDATYGKVETFERTMLAECLKGILGTCRSESARWATLKRRKADLIEPYQENERSDGYLLYDLKSLIRPVFHILH